MTHAGHIIIKKYPKERRDELRNLNYANQQRTMRYRKRKGMCTTDPSTIPGNTQER